MKQLNPNQQQINSEVFYDIIENHVDGAGSMVSFCRAMELSDSYSFFKSIDLETDGNCFEFARREFLAFDGLERVVKLRIK